VTNAPHLQVLASSCTAGSCPTVYRTTFESALVQGYTVPGNEGVDVPLNEGMVKIPVELLIDAASAWAAKRGFRSVKMESLIEGRPRRDLR
jgi:hypothetical protein